MTEYAVSANRGELFRRPLSMAQLVIGGIIIPLICFAVDLAIGINVSGYAPFAIWTLAVLGMIALVLSVPYWRHRVISFILVGALAAAGLGAGFLGIVFLPFAIIGILFYGLGLLGLMPLLTSIVYLRRARELFRQDQRTRVGWIAVGFLTLALPPILLQAAEWKWIDGKLDLVTNPDTRVAQPALKALADYPFQLGRGTDWICPRIDKIRVDDENIVRKLERIVGYDPVPTCQRSTLD